MAKRGRPHLEDPRKHQYRIRLNDKELEELDWLSEVTKIDKANIIRFCLRRYYLEMHDKLCLTSNDDIDGY